MSTASLVLPAPGHLGFELPGIKSRGYGGYAVATALVHSGRFNIRGREYHSYSFCSMVLQDLVDDLAPTALVIPQFELDAFTVSHPASIFLTDSIDSLPQPGTRGPVPDFVVILVRAVLHATSMPIPLGIRLDFFEYWGKIKIENLVVGLVVEVKRRATRSAKNPAEFMASLTGRIEAARVDARDQATAAFLAHEGTDRLLLIAWSGEWYSWMMAVREDFAIAAMPRRRIVSEDEAEDPWEAEGIPEDVDQGPNSDPESGGKEASSELSSDAEADVPRLAPCEQDVQDVQEVQDQHSSTRRRTSTRERELLPRVSKSGAATLEGFYMYKDPLGDISDAKIAYNPNLKAKESKKKSEEMGKEMGQIERLPLRKPRKATFKRYTPADLGVMETQQLLTPEQCNDTGLFRDNWSEPILFGTLVSKQNWSLIHRFLERQSTRLNMRNAPGDDDSSQAQDSEDQNEDGRPRNEKGDTSEDRDEQDVDLDEYSTESSDDDYVP